MNIKEWDGSINLNEDITETFNSVFNELVETGVSRSPFQLARFVIQYHGSLKDGAGPIMRQQALREIEGCMEGILRTRINLKRLNREIEVLSEERPKDFDLDILEIKISIRKEILSLIKKHREYIVLKEILRQLPKYTWKEFQETEPKRWANRLMRQCNEHKEALLCGLDRGDIQAINQAQLPDILSEIGIIEDDLIEEHYKKLKNPIGLDEILKLDD